METQIRQIYKQAKQIGCCNRFKGTENLSELIDLFRSPQGIEFCMAHRFPSLSTFAMFPSKETEEKGIFINSGSIELHNPGKVVLVGDTTATILCDSPDILTDIYVMHGAKATIYAKGWAVASIEVADGVTESHREDQAIILQKVSSHNPMK